MTVIVDYGAGNLRSVENTLAALGAQYTVTNKPEVVQQASRLILPGVGHFGQMVRALDELNLRNSIVGRIRADVPFLGICVGLQCLFEASEESPGSAGLGLFPGAVKRFSGEGRIPHMGWNSLVQRRRCRLLSGLGETPFTYFAHSYYAPVIEATAATCTYMQPYTAVLEQNNVYAVQFHPEKSGSAGLHVMDNFLQLSC
ncbi:MAG TPA: imidazole glycerol phosphate synthase subunit HisH [Bryobacteraceae bacterium]|nr:imidazole glycerol phosphate synthase subunit HisH [Bryobacteraceae bacterium]